MKPLAVDLPDFDRTIGTANLCAWSTSEGSCRVQTHCPEMGRLIPKLVECERVGTGIIGRYTAIYAIKRTLPWVERNVVSKILAQFPNEMRGSEIRNGLSGFNPSSGVAG